MGMVSAIFSLQIQVCRGVMGIVQARPSRCHCCVQGGETDIFCSRHRSDRPRDIDRELLISFPHPGCAHPWYCKFTRKPLDTQTLIQTHLSSGAGYGMADLFLPGAVTSMPQHLDVPQASPWRYADHQPCRGGSPSTAFGTIVIDIGHLRAEGSLRGQGKGGSSKSNAWPLLVVFSLEISCLDVNSLARRQGETDTFRCRRGRPPIPTTLRRDTASSAKQP